MNLKNKLSQRIGKNDIQEIILLTQGDDVKKQELYNLLFDQDDKISYQAAWIITHFPAKESEYFHHQQNELIDEALRCNHTGKRRLILAIIYRLTLVNPPRIDF